MSLQDRSIVITRPIDQCLEIASKIEELNGKPIIFPCIEIEALDSNEAWQALKTDLEIIDLAIFVSSNAVSHGLTPLLEFAPQSLHVAAVGSGTSKQLQDMGIDKVLSPEGQFDSESLLELPELQQAKNILIIKGVGGRTLLKETLQERGANVFSIDVYRRHKPNNNNSDLLNQYLDLILFFSKESVENMLSMLPNKLHQRILNCQTIVGHSSIATKVTSLGFKKLPIIATNPSAAEMLTATLEWSNNTGKLNNE